MAKERFVPISEMVPNLEGVTPNRDIAMKVHRQLAATTGLSDADFHALCKEYLSRGDVQGFLKKVEELAAARGITVMVDTAQREVPEPNRN